MTLRKDMLGALDDIQQAAQFTEKDWQRWAHVATHPDIQAAHALHMQGLRMAWRIIADFGADPEAFDALLRLQKEKPADFKAIMVLVQIELERRPEAVAA